ncbi:MAG: hypothetical protein JNL28_15935 [Planctomycetes bacterium]|nr:hypothetical protein [Planctomycetota bacterium]
MKLILGLGLFLLAPCFAPAPALAQDGRREAQLAEDQALLKRQLQRLKQTMEVLAARFEGEGRTHAAKLLRDGLKHLDVRVDELGSKTVEELMLAATQALESGATVQSVENQEAVVKSLEKLYAILTDRAGLEDLQKSLEELKAVKADLEALANRESKLREQTAKLQEQAATAEQKALQQALQDAIAEQRALLDKTEKDARSASGLALEEIQRELARLAAQQATDAGVMSSWKPEDKSALERAAKPLSEAGEEALRASRLARAASELREAARKTRAAANDMSAVERELAAAAEREDRHQRASGDPAAKKAAEELNKAAATARKTGADQAERDATANALEAQARELDAAARLAMDAAQAARAEAAKALAAAADPKSPAGQAAENAKKAMDAAQKADAAARSSDPNSPPGASATPPEGAEKRLEEAQRATAEAQRAVQQGLEEQKTLPPALSSSQASAAQESEKLSRAIDGLPEGASPAAQKAKDALSQAASKQKSASESAKASDARAAQKSAEEARAELEKARDALGELTDEAAAARAGSPQQKALEAAQSALAQKTGAMKKQSGESGLASPKEAAAESALSRAQEAMKDAAQKLSQGKSAQATESQQDALKSLNEAAKAAAEGARQMKPEDAAEAREQAAEQERIRQALLALAERNKKRNTAQPAPSLDRAQQSAGAAQENLEEGDLDEAQKNEEKTEREMRKALEELGQEEEQYQKLRQEELLFKIAEQVRTLLEEHRAAMKDTLEIDQQRTGGQKTTHTQKLRLRKIAKVEEALAKRAAEIGKAILAEGSLVFAEMLDEAEKDLMRIGRDMSDAGDFQSGDRVQTLQQDVEQSLVWLQEALAQEKERRRQEEQDKQQQPPGEKRPPSNRLVPDVAELKLLRRMEVDILDSIDQMRILHPEIAEGKVLDSLLFEDISRLAVRHQKMSELFSKFRKRLGIPDPEPKQDDQ